MCTGIYDLVYIYFFRFNSLIYDLVRYNLTFFVLISQKKKYFLFELILVLKLFYDLVHLYFFRFNSVIYDLVRYNLTFFVLISQKKSTFYMN